MRILVLSDNHGDCTNIRRAAEREKDIDLVFHLGDNVRTENAIREMFEVPVDFVAGNMDFDSFAPQDLVVTKCGHTMYLTHGHNNYVQVGIDILAGDAAARGATIALYGHTHKPKAALLRGIYIFNPGSISRPRQEDGRCTYAVLVLEEGKEPDFELRYL